MKTHLLAGLLAIAPAARADVARPVGESLNGAHSLRTDGDTLGLETPPLNSLFDFAHIYVTMHAISHTVHQASALDQDPESIAGTTSIECPYIVATEPIDFQQRGSTGSRMIWESQVVLP